MDDTRTALAMLTRALEHLRFAGLSVDLAEPALSRKIYGVADLVHNIPAWIHDPSGMSLRHHLLLHAGLPAAAAWLEEIWPEITGRPWEAPLVEDESAERPQRVYHSNRAR